MEILALAYNSVKIHSCFGCPAVQYYGQTWTLSWNICRIKNKEYTELPYGPMVRTWCFLCCGLGLIPGWGTKIPQAMKNGQQKRKKVKKQKQANKPKSGAQREKTNIRPCRTGLIHLLNFPLNFCLMNNEKNLYVIINKYDACSFI